MFYSFFSYLKRDMEDEEIDKILDQYENLEVSCIVSATV